MNDYSRLQGLLNDRVEKMKGKGEYDAIVAFSGGKDSCTFFGMLTVLKVVIDKKVPFVLHGRSRAQMFKELVPKSSDPFYSFWMTNFSSYDVNQNREYMCNSIDHLNTTLKTLIPYDEEKLIRVLEEDLGWKKMKALEILGHQDCIIHCVASYLYTLVCRYPLLTQELSTMVREGNLSRIDASKRLGLEQYIDVYDPIAMEVLCKGTKLSQKEVLKFARYGRIIYPAYKFVMRFIPFNKRGQQLYNDTLAS